jgi:APA family basic amino acid/polyamine antiporter
VPFVSLLTQGAIAIILALSGSFDQLTDYVVFANWIFYALVSYSVFLFRKKRPEAPRAYRVLGYPWIPAIFIMMAILLLINTLIQSPKESFLGLILIVFGCPIYWMFYRKAQ